MLSNLEQGETLERTGRIILLGSTGSIGVNTIEVVSHLQRECGIEYEIDISDRFTVNDHTGAHIAFNVFRSVDTEGWISGDFHVHGAASHDSGVVAANRVRQAETGTDI